MAQHEMTQAEFDRLTKQYYANRVPNYHLNTPSLSPNGMASMDAGNSVMSNTPTMPKEGLDWSNIGMAVGQALAPIGASILGRNRDSRLPSTPGAPSLGMTRGAEIPNVYGGRTNPVISALLARYLGRR